MRQVFELLHLLTAIFAIGPLAHVTTTAAKSLRSGSPERAREASRLTRLYSIASVLPVMFGFGLMSQKGRDGKPLGSFSDPWIWGSIVLWLAAVGVAMFLIAPALEEAAGRVEASEDASSLRGRVAAFGGTVGLLFAAVIVLMVYRP